MDYVFVSHMKTILSLSEGGDFIHEGAETAPLNLRFDADGQPCQPTSFVVERLPNGGGFAIETQAGYLSAENGGKITLRPNCFDWEIFKLQAVNEVGRIKNPVVPDLPVKPRAHSIPKIIHQTYSSANLPEEAEYNVYSLRQLNPGWDYRYWSEKDRHDFIYQYFGWEILNAYLRINLRYGAARADFFRYLCIYQLGGVYIDIKSGCSKPFDQIIQSDDQYLLSHWLNQPGQQYAGWGMYPELAHIERGEFEQWHVIAAPGHPFLEQVLRQVLRNIFSYSIRENGVGADAVMQICGPIAYTLAIHPILDRHPHRFFESHLSGLNYQATNRPKKAGGGYQDQKTPLIL